jgi:hypothetical protein
MTSLVRNDLKTRIIAHQIKFGLFVSKLRNNSELQKIILLPYNCLIPEFQAFAHAAVQNTQVFILRKSNPRKSANVVMNELWQCQALKSKA